MSEPPTLASKVKQFGLTQIYTDEKPQVDVVFVHGLNGNPYNTWASKKTDNFWPVHLLPEILEANQVQVRILLYGYNANVHAFTDGVSKDRIHNHAETLASGLAANRSLRGCKDRPIIFVCHSLGGLVVKRALIYCNGVLNEKIEHLRSIFVCTYGILFLGTPHNGSDFAKWGVLLENICSAVMPKKFMETSPNLVKSLRTNNETLQNINSLFAEVMGRFHIYFFHETRSTDVKGSRELIVDESSAAPYAEGVERMGIEADHSNMCKFDDENAAGFEAVAEAILRYSRDAPATVKDRWVEEDKTRYLRKQTKANEILTGQGQGQTQADRVMGGSAPDLRSYGTNSNTAVIRVSPSEGGNSPASEVTATFKSPPLIKPDPLFVVPPGFHPNATFIGMQKELDILHTRLFKAKKRANRLVAVLVCGVPGSGKSHLAREYVWTHRGDYPGGVFWIDAKLTQSIFKCFWDIAQAATLTDGGEFENPDKKTPSRYVEAVRHWLQSREEWLLIFDGITFKQEGDINHFKQFLPFNKRCSIIYTSVDRTLRKKQRLYEPYCLRVPPLQNEDACKLLFKDLAIKRPTKEQYRKATDLVHHYEGLPLAIHAISHRLSATAKPIEKYHINSHLTDEKLAEPFLGIMHDLFRLGHVQALNLINILSFLGHHVPVGLVNLGKGALETWEVDILTSSRIGERGDLDTTLGILIRYGLIERTSDSYPLQPNSFSTNNDELDMRSVVPELSESQTESSGDFFSIYQNAGTIDVIKIHGVVQGFCRDELKIKDEEGKMNRTSADADAGYYDSWLLVATRVFCRSYENAMHKMQCSDDRGLVKDYREYETHASRLMENFPRRSIATPMVREARDELKQVMKSIAAEIERISPSSSQESIVKHRSVFDRSSSSSSSVPGSSADEGPSRLPTFDFKDLESPKEVESPQEMVPSQRFNLGPFPPHIYRETSTEAEAEAEGYETDNEKPKAVIRSSPALSQMSETTAKPSQSQESLNEDEWKTVEKPSKPRARGKSRQRSSRFPRNMRGPKPAAPILKVFPVAVEGRSASNESGGGRRSSQVSASEALAAIHKPGASLTRGDNASTPTSQESLKENLPTYASVAAKRAQEIEGSKPRSTSTPGGRQRPMASELKAENMTRSTYSEPGKKEHVAGRLSALNLGPTPQFQTRRPSVASLMGPVEPARDNALAFLPPLPYDHNIEVTVSRRVSAANPAVGASVSHPSAIMPGVSPPPSLAPDVPGGRGYASDPAPEPMTRNPSNQSHQSWSTEPARYPPRFSPMPTGMSSTAGMDPTTLPHAMHHHLVPQQQTIAGAGSWISDMATPPPPPPPMASAIQTDIASAYAAQSQIRQQVPMSEHVQGLAPGWGSQSQPQLQPQPSPQPSPQPQSTLHFGGHRVDVRDAQHRLLGMNRVQTRQVPAYQLYHSNLSQPLIQHEMIVPAPETYAVRTRSGSSPSPPPFDGLGLHLG